MFITVNDIYFMFQYHLEFLTRFLFLLIPTYNIHLIDLVKLNHNLTMRTIIVGYHMDKSYPWVDLKI